MFASVSFLFCCVPISFVEKRAAVSVLLLQSDSSSFSCLTRFALRLLLLSDGVPCAVETVLLIPPITGMCGACESANNYDEERLWAPNGHSSGCFSSFFSVHVDVCIHFSCCILISSFCSYVRRAILANLRPNPNYPNLFRVSLMDRSDGHLSFLSF